MSHDGILDSLREIRQASSCCIRAYIPITARVANRPSEVALKQVPVSRYSINHSETDNSLLVVTSWMEAKSPIHSLTCSGRFTGHSESAGLNRHVVGVQVP